VAGCCKKNDNETSGKEGINLLSERVSSPRSVLRGILIFYQGLTNSQRQLDINWSQIKLYGPLSSGDFVVYRKIGVVKKLNLYVTKFLRRIIIFL